MQNLYNLVLGIAGICALAFLGVLIFGQGIAAGGPFLVGFLICLAIGGLGTPMLRQLAFTVWIFAGVAMAMYYPRYFQTVGDFELKTLIVPLIQVIMFGMGTAMSLKDFEGVVKMPKGVVVGLVAQLTIMPLIGASIALLMNFPAEVAAGIILIGSAPSGVASNVMAYIAKANLALSITLTAVATLLAPLTTPFLMKILAGQLVPIDFVAMMIGIIKMVIVPIVLGLLFNRLVAGRAPWLDKAMPLLSMIAIAVVITIITATGRDALLTIGPLLFLAAIIHNASGYLIGYWGCKMVGLDEQSCRTISIEVGMQNGGLASGIALQMGKVATVGLAPAIFGPWMNITGSALANWWRNRAPESETAPEQPAEMTA
ncbi:MAG: bile acid:sodium symporter family protein [Bacteroidota bacterium]